jgi:hypothetical protein
MAEFWIEVVEMDGQFVAKVRELIAHNNIGGSSWIYDLRFSTSRYETSEAAFNAGETELRGLLSQLGRPECVITAEQRSGEENG